MSINTKLCVGVIGLGGAGRAHARRLNRNPNVKQVFGFDSKRVTGIEDVITVSNLEKLLNNVDAVTICTPDHLHFECIITALSAGKHVLVEKPMVASLSQAKRLQPYLARHPRLVFGVHHQMRYVPAFLKAAELIKQGRLGKLFYLEANYWHDMRTRASLFDKWRQKHGQSLIFGHGCHPLDLLMHLVGQTPVRHTTYLSKNGNSNYAPYTSATTLLQFKNNIIAKCHINSFCVYPQVNDLIIMGDKGTYIDGVLYTDKGFEQLVDFFSDSGWLSTELNITKTGLPRRVVSLAINAYLRTFNKLALLVMHQPDFGFRRYPLTVYNHDYACQYVIDNFIAAVLGKEKILAGYNDAVRVITLCEDLETEGLSNMAGVKR